LAGTHQIENAKIAVKLAEALNEFFPIRPANIIEGLETASHRGRLEFYKNVLFDGAHNPAGAESLRDFLVEFVRYPIVMIFGAMKGKDISRIAATLFPKADKLILTAVDNPRSTRTTDLMKVLPNGYVKSRVFQTETVAEALETARKISSENDLILVTGSLYLVGEAQKILQNDPKF
jgi:dihydrofolate synthase/folylpolyglutamate synthase